MSASQPSTHRSYSSERLVRPIAVRRRLGVLILAQRKIRLFTACTLTSGKRSYSPLPSPDFREVEGDVSTVAFFVEQPLEGSVGSVASSNRLVSTETVCYLLPFLIWLATPHRFGHRFIN